MSQRLHSFLNRKGLGLMVLSLIIMQYLGGAPQQPRGLSNPDSDKPVTVAYGFNGYIGDMYSVPAALAAIFHENNVYGVLVDGSVDASKIAELKRLITKHVLEAPGHGCESAACVESRVFVEAAAFSVTYAGISEPLATLDVMQMLLEFDADWDFFVNLTPLDYPLASQEDIVQILAKMKGRSYCGVSDGTLPNHADGVFMKRWKSNYFDPSVLRLRDPKEHEKLQRMQQADPGLGIVMDDGLLNVFHAEAYGIFERSFCAHVLESKVTYRVIALLSRGWASSEQVLPMILMNQDEFKHCGFIMRGNNAASGPAWPMQEGGDETSFLNAAKDSGLLFYRKFAKVASIDPVTGDADALAAAYESEFYRTILRNSFGNATSEYAVGWKANMEIRTDAILDQCTQPGYRVLSSH